MSPKSELLEALQRFEKRITFSATRADFNTLYNVIAENIKISYYILRTSATPSYCGEAKITFNVEYKDTEVPLGDVHVVSTNEEAHSILCQYIGNYKTRLVLFAKPGVNIESEYQRFITASAPFYPNYLKAEISMGRLDAKLLPYYEFCFDYRIGRVKLAMMENEINEEIARLASQLFLPGMSDEAKAFLAHNYLAHTIKYTLKDNISSLEKSYMQSAYGALIKKKCVCQGYAEAFKRLMDYAGIPCEIVCGQIKGDTVYHAWNIIKLNGGRDNYHIDVTWDSAEDKVSYAYFGLKDSDLVGERTWSKEFNARCTSGKNLLLEARRGVMRFRSLLALKGVSASILGY